ncbi:MAG: TIGR03790 family protein [Phycisphaerae bacterium]|jgi:uncharacterized protein (TIGR03790 family)|nr:TIGR03790 family protein [Phycisphaerae bacterium]
MSKNRTLFAILLAAATTAICTAQGFAAGGAGGLKPDQVLVVANANSVASRDLAAFYALRRGIPKRNIVLVKTAATYTISRKDYRDSIRRPIAQAMLERRLDLHIRSICLIWGVPVRIAEGSVKAPAPTGGIEVFHKAQAKEALAKMAVYHELLKLVGKPPTKLPAVPADRIESVADLFDKPLPSPTEKTPAAEVLFKRLRKSIVRRYINVRFSSDKTKKPIGERQLMALHRELYGLKGLIEFLRDAKISKPPDIETLGAMLKKAEGGLNRLSRPETPKTLANARARIELLKQSGGLRLVAGYAAGGTKPTTKLKLRRRKASKLLMKTTASLDSELAMLWRGDYKTEGPLTNPLYWKRRGATGAKGRPKALMTARMDAPSVTLVRRVIDDSIAVEKTGLKGIFYIDSGLPMRFAKAANNTGYRAYDNRFKALHAFVTRRAGIKAVLDTSAGLFAPGKCPDAALYAGWYSLRKYVPAFTWKTGAVGWHTASFEAADLRNPKSSQWCPQMLTNGVAATAGAVDEPLLMAFPAPEEFFPLLLTGKYTIAECYWRTVPNVSWQMTLIADPLYNPFKKNPQVLLKHLPPGLAP